ncbi:MAG: TolC family protein [Planctomycetes bacterium]|nr:TolC family protein [Planctomycetota bacterium]
MTLADCIQVALQHNPHTRISWESSRSALARVGEKRAAYLPSLAVSAQAAHGKSPSLDSDTEREAHDTYAAEIDVSYLLLDGGSRRAHVESAEAALLAANFRHNTTLQNAALTVEESYYDLLGAQWLLKVMQDTVKRTQYQLELAQARHKAGVVTRADVLRAQTQRAEAELFEVRARNGVRIARGRLANSMGLPVHTAFDIQGSSDEIQGKQLPRIEQLLDEAATKRPELKAALARIQGNRAELSAVRSESWPTLSATGSLGKRDTDFVPEEDEWSVGVSVNYSLFDGLDRSYRRRRAHAELSRAIAEHAALLQGIELEVWTSYWKLVETGEAIEAATALATSAGESARLAEGEYKTGAISIVGLIDAQTSQSEAERLLVQSRLDWYTAKAQFERVVGLTLAHSTKLSGEKGEE